MSSGFSDMAKRKKKGHKATVLDVGQKLVWVYDTCT